MLLAGFSSSGRLWPLCLYCWLEFLGGSGDFVAGSSVHASTLLAIAIRTGPGCTKEKTTNYNCMSIIFSWNCSRITEVELGRQGQEGASQVHQQPRFCLSATLACHFYPQGHHKASKAPAILPAIQAVRRGEGEEDKQENSFLYSIPGCLAQHLLDVMGCAIILVGQDLVKWLHLAIRKSGKYSLSARYFPPGLNKSWVLLQSTKRGPNIGQAPVNLSHRPTRDSQGLVK